MSGRPRHSRTTASMRPARARQRTRPAFTLIELLVVIAILSLLLSVLLPSLSRARELARIALCLTQQRGLCIPEHMYESDYGCLCPAGYRPNGGGGSPDYFWYQKPFLGKYLSEDIPRYASVDGHSPPKKSILRCPSPAVWEGIKPDKSWIGYNCAMSYPYEPEGTDCRCYWRGPKISEIRKPIEEFVLFEDCRGSGFLYLCNWAYNDLTGWNARVGDYSSGTFDPRHLDGLNYSFLDGHAKYFRDGDTAFFESQIHSTAAYSRN